jgi:GntR family transcriptional regulator, arabinose operon transcriptional repressor
MSTSTQPPKVFQYVQVADQIRRQIAKGILKPGDRLLSRREMRERYGVNFNTLEKAHALLEEENLIVRSHRSGVFVAQPGRRPPTGSIGFCGVSFTQSDFSAYWTHVLEGAENAAHEFDSRITLLSIYSSSGWDKVDGLVINSLDARIPAKYVPSGLPIVSLFAPPLITGTDEECSKIEEDVSVIRIDDYFGMRSATQHLLALGHRRIAYLRNNQDPSDFHQLRLDGYLHPLREAGIKADPRWVRCLPEQTSRVHFMNSGREGMRQWLEGDWAELGCTALLAHNDDVAWGVVDVLREAGISVPDQVSVVGFDGTEMAECCNPQLTTVEVPLREMGRTAVELLQQQIKAGSGKTEVTLQPQLCLRASTAPLPEH